jgi:hypothetical protein
MEWLNYHHLLYFWVVAREGSIAHACKELNLARQVHWPQTGKRHTIRGDDIHGTALSPE